MHLPTSSHVRNLYQFYKSSAMSGALCMP